MANENARTNTSTQIRNLYSEGFSYLNVSFFNINLSFKFHKYLSKDNMGKNIYDLKNGLNTTVNYEGAAALFAISKDILDNKIQECTLPIPCASAELLFERKPGPNGMETWFSITKNGVTVPFKFNTMIVKVKENGQERDKIVETGLIVFNAIVDAYLDGINADRHLDKLTEDYAKLMESNNGQNGYRNNGNYKKPYNGNNNYNKDNYRNKFNQNQNWNPQSQNMSSYQLKN